MRLFLKPPTSVATNGTFVQDDGGMEIVLYTDCINYRGMRYVDSMVTFSRSFVEVKSKTADGNRETFHIQLEIEDIVKIESQWSARNAMGFIIVHFISNNTVAENSLNDVSVSGIQELNFPASDSNWYEKQEAIGSLNARYKELWKVLLDDLDDCTEAAPEGKAVLLSRDYFPDFHESFEEVIYPKGDPDAVTVSSRDVDLLQPDTFLNDTVIDFYINYLRNKQKPQDRNRFHFFNSFFFRKLADMDKDPSSAFDGRAAFLRVRKWTRKVNLLEKDFIVIPVNYNFHWSLIVICYFGKVADCEDLDANKSSRVPCILHMDSLKGTHAGLKDLMQSYLWEEWKERQKGANEDFYSKFMNMKFISLELPQQPNSFDCGLFLLHYVELFLEEVPLDFNIHKITSLSNFLTADWFPPGEASMKRAHIERVIYALLFENCSGGCSLPVDSDMRCYPNGTETTNEYVNFTKLVSEKSCPSKDFPESSLVGSGVEITLLPTSSLRSTQCTGDTGLVLREFFETGSASQPFNDAHCQAFEQQSSLSGLKRPIPPNREEVEANRTSVYTEPAEISYHHLDVSPAEASSLFLYPPVDFELETVDQSALEESDSSLAASVSDSDKSLEVKDDDKCQPVEEISLHDKIQEPRCILEEKLEHLGETNHHDDSAHLTNSFPSNLPGLYHQGIEFTAASVSGDVLLDVSGSQSQIQVLDPNDRVDPFTCSSKNSPRSSHHDNDDVITGESELEPDVHRAAKRMRLEAISEEKKVTDDAISEEKKVTDITIFEEEKPMDGAISEEEKLTDDISEEKTVMDDTVSEEEKLTDDISNTLHL